MINIYKLEKQKVYKSPAINIVNIHPGDLKRLPDDCFSYPFININGEKICIEVGNTYHHKNDYEQKRKEHFANMVGNVLFLLKII